MEAKIRLDNTGSPYLAIVFTESDSETKNAEEDAEKIFFNQLKNNGGKLHVYTSRNDERVTKVLLVSNIEKRGFYKISDEAIAKEPPRVTAIADDAEPMLDAVQEAPQQ